jgi:hypothetical protein
VRRGVIANDESAHPAIADEDVGAESEHEPRNAQLARGTNSGREVVGRCGFIQHVRRSADAKRGERREWLAQVQLTPVKQRSECVNDLFGGHETVFRVAATGSASITVLMERASTAS